ncbi:uncharacterized protein LOC104894095 [Beta vulgaris subsp. vulgaris]|uniref:uncharacterized protein LOC104894095 n=1 Tax=Beta vulgaris subsp. vulgaris TaxID=3555 RepID=UPI00053F66EC|nr:uncharacterized protein LOC104894095 [Beta vulgaris subsp. vulgaris]
MLANQAWQELFPTAEVNFQNEGGFDHSSALLLVHKDEQNGKKAFRYFTMWKKATQFEELVKQAWDTPVHVQGSKMFIVMQKLKQVKIRLKEMSKRGFHDLQAEEIKAQQVMMHAQQQMHLNPSDRVLADAELEALIAGDENTRVYHQSIKAKRLKNRIKSIKDEEGNWHNKADSLANAFLAYYKKLLGSNVDQRIEAMSQIVQAGPLVSDAHRAILNAPYTTEEVKNSLFSIPASKAPGPDGFGSYFYKDAWHIIEEDVVVTVLDTLIP